MRDSKLQAEIDELKEANECLLKTLANYDLFAEGLTRGRNKDESFATMMAWQPKIGFDIAARLKHPSAQKKFLFGS